MRREVRMVTSSGSLIRSWSWRAAPRRTKRNLLRKGGQFRTTLGGESVWVEADGFDIVSKVRSLTGVQTR